jgi:hypothetical protein
MPNFGDSVDRSKIKNGAAPILFQVQPDGYVKLTSEAEIRDWERRLKEMYGIDAKSLVSDS